MLDKLRISFSDEAIDKARDVRIWVSSGSSGLRSLRKTGRNIKSLVMEHRYNNNDWETGGT